MPETVFRSRRLRSKSKSVIMSQITTETKQRAKKICACTLLQHFCHSCNISSTVLYTGSNFHIGFLGKLLQFQLPVTLYCITNIVL